MRNVIVAMLSAAVLQGCDGFVGEVTFDGPKGAPIPIVAPDYVVLRSVRSDSFPGASVAVNLGRTVYFDESERILDLANLDPRTVSVEKGLGDTYVILIGTTERGHELLSAWTAANIGQQLGIFVDGRLVCAPFIKSKLTHGILIDGEFSRGEAQSVAKRLERGGAAV